MAGNKNSGRKVEAKGYSDIFKKTLLKGLKKKAKAEGKNWEDVFADLFYDDGTQDTVRASLFKVLADCMVVKETKSTEIKETRKVIMLPHTKEPDTTPNPVGAEKDEKEVTH